MAYETFPWSSIDIPNGIEVTEHCHTIKHAYGGGYMASRARSTRMQKRFTPIWHAMTAASWVELTTFWRTVSGSADAFYWQFPVGIYGVSGWGGVEVDNPPAGWDADEAIGWGDGPIFLARFEEDSLVQKYDERLPNRWAVSVAILELA